MSPAQKQRNFFQFALVFVAAYLMLQILLRFFFPDQFGGSKPQNTGVILKPQAEKMTEGRTPVIIVENRTDRMLRLPNRCPNPPVSIALVADGTPKEQTLGEDAPDSCVPLTEIGTGATVHMDLAPWKYLLLSERGEYQAKLTIPAEGNAQAQELTTTFRIVEPGVFTKLFRTFIMAPFLNFLIFVASLLPDHNLGVAIIVLTLLVKLLLFFPTQKSLEGQKKMQMLQPKIEALKKMHGSDAKKLQEETMKLWKEHKINPFSSCLPMLLQFPILIGLFYVIRDGSHLEVSHHLIYNFYSNLPWSFNTNFLGMDLLKPNLYVMPALLVILQFLQMKLTFAVAERKKAKDAKIVDVTPGGKAKAEPSAQATQQKVMLYGLPIMIGFFAIQFPAAVSLYWGVSTLFAIGQQMIVNREHLRV